MKTILVILISLISVNVFAQLDEQTMALFEAEMFKKIDEVGIITYRTSNDLEAELYNFGQTTMTVSLNRHEGDINSIESHLIIKRPWGKYRCQLENYYEFDKILRNYAAFLEASDINRSRLEIKYMMNKELKLRNFTMVFFTKIDGKMGITTKGCEHRTYTTVFTEDNEEYFDGSLFYINNDNMQLRRANAVLGAWDNIIVNSDGLVNVPDYTNEGPRINFVIDFSYFFENNIRVADQAISPDSEYSIVSEVDLNFFFKVNNDSTGHPITDWYEKTVYVHKNDVSLYEEMLSKVQDVNGDVINSLRYSFFDKKLFRSNVPSGINIRFQVLRKL